MTFREDESRIRKGSGALVFNLFKQDKTKSASLARKKKMATLDDKFRSSLMEQGVKMR